jgi:uncharacterized protein (UPF0335 family)
MSRIDELKKFWNSELQRLVARVESLQKEKEEIVDDALKCAHFCDVYKERLASAEEALREINNGYHTNIQECMNYAHAYFDKFGGKNDT